MLSVSYGMGSFQIQHDLHQQHIIVYFADYAIYGKTVKVVYLANKSTDKPMH